MLEEMLMNVVQAMSDSLDEEQLDKLQNVLYIQFHNKKIVEDKCELQATGADSDTAKIRLLLPARKCLAGKTIRWHSTCVRLVTAGML